MNGYTSAVLPKDFQNTCSQQQRGFVFVCGQNLSVFTHNKTLNVWMYIFSTPQEFFKTKVPSLWGFFHMHTGCLLGLKCFQKRKREKHMISLYQALKILLLTKGHNPFLSISFGYLQ